VHPWCDGSKGPVTCGSESETKDRKRDVEKARKLIDDLKDKKTKAESNRSSATTDDDKRKFDDEVRQLERDIYDAEKQLDAAKLALDGRRKHIEDAIYTLDKCIAFRRAVMNAFASALDKMRNEDDTPDIKTVASSLVRKYEKAKSGHEQQITAKKNAYENCKDWRP
jgi:chromosome segregation ATPase